MCTSVRKWWNWLELVDLLLFSPRCAVAPRCAGDKDNNNWQIAPLIYQSGRNRVLTNTPLNRAASATSSSKRRPIHGVTVPVVCSFVRVLFCVLSSIASANTLIGGKEGEGGQSPPPLVAAIWPDIPRIKYVLWLAHRTSRHVCGVREAHSFVVSSRSPIPFARLSVRDESL